VRVGFGFDAHALVPGRPLVLGGCQVPFERGLEGYSDADVIAHAAIDAILGAAGLGDCGSRFPAGDARYAGIASVMLLAEAARLAREAGFEVGNLECTVVAEQPQLAPYLERMRAALATALRVPVERCGVHAKRTEGLGFTGAGEGIAAFAVAALESKQR
jgi:2-C-methyl-D-erythritol 2,4-cyclodiphosphate synthase